MIQGNVTPFNTPQVQVLCRSQRWHAQRGTSRAQSVKRNVDMIQRAAGAEKLGEGCLHTSFKSPVTQLSCRVKPQVLSRQCQGDW